VKRWHVDVEVLVLRLLPEGSLGHRWVRGALPTNIEPDARAVELVGCEHGLCHSTSWRHEGRGVLVLTYAAVPDPATDLAAEPLGSPLVVSGGGALRPTPSDLDAAHVAAHAVRHLADLAERDPVVRELVRDDPQLWAAVSAAARHAQHSHAFAAS
jgi:hypothetical protein